MGDEGKVISLRIRDSDDSLNPWVRLAISILVSLILGASAWSAHADLLEDSRIAPDRKDYASAAAILNQQLMAGDVSATYSLGLAYLKGRGIGVDADLGLALIYQAAQAGNARAQSYLGSLYEFGDHVEQDGKLAWFWTEKAAYQNFGPAQLTLGTYYWLLGTPEDRISALMWVELALHSTPESEPQRGFAESTRDMFRAMMTRAEINQAERAAHVWIEKN